MIRRLLDIPLLGIVLLLSPIWLWRMFRRGKLRTDWAGRLGSGAVLPRRRGGSGDGSGDAPAARVLLHAVSVGEVNAVRDLVRELQDAGAEPIISVMTDTGFARASNVFRGVCPVVRTPFDFAFAVSRWLRRIRPDVLVLTELEVWPNMTGIAAERKIPIVVVNGRLTARSFRGYQRMRRLVSRSFRRITQASVQTEDYAQRFRALGVAADRVHVHGTMKWDTARIADSVDGAAELAEALGVDRSRPVVVAGSTAPDETALIDKAVGPDAQLIIAPRKPEWFDQAARDLPGCCRRSRDERSSGRGRYLLDTIGDLRAAYALADVVIVGRSFGELYGSDMMEPIALGRAVIVGPSVSDFQVVCDQLREAGGLLQVHAEELRSAVVRLLGDPSERQRLAECGRNVIRREQGATVKNAAVILDVLHRPGTKKPDTPDG